MAASAAKNPLARARKLMGLARSANEHESDLAAARAREFMEKHGIRPEDLEDDVTEVLETTTDPYRREIAAGLAQFHECSAAVNNRGEIALRGRPSVIEEAKSAYWVLVDRADTESRVGLVVGSPGPVREAWRRCFWLGFADSVSHRCQEAVKARGAPAPKPRKKRAARVVTEAESVVYDHVSAPEPEPPEPVVEVRSGTAEVAESLRGIGYVDTNWLQRCAVAAGRAVGQAISLGAPQSARRTLGATQET